MLKEGGVRVWKWWYRTTNGERRGAEDSTDSDVTATQIFFPPFREIFSFFTECPKIVFDTNSHRVV